MSDEPRKKASKNGAIMFLIVFCCITVVPLLILLLNACMTENYEDSILSRLIQEMD